jgi:hypothetical protein
LKKRDILKHTILGRIRGAIGTCRKPQIMFWYTTYLVVVLMFISTKHGILL